jgi:hypothetical protein
MLAPEGLPHLVHRGQQAPIRLARHDAVAPTRVLSIIGRIAVDGQEDLPTVAAL